MVASGKASFNRAAPPDTCGVAIDVPDNSDILPSIALTDTILAPGAMKSAPEKLIAGPIPE